MRCRCTMMHLLTPAACQVDPLKLLLGFGAVMLDA